MYIKYRFISLSLNHVKTDFLDKPYNVRLIKITKGIIGILGKKGLNIFQTKVKNKDLIWRKELSELFC